MSLFEPAPGASPRRFAEWLSTEMANQEACAAAAGQTFLGLYQAAIDLYPGSRPQTNWIGGRCAMIQLAHAASIEEAIQRELRPETPSTTAFQMARRAWIDPASVRRLWLVPMCRSSFATAPLRLDGKLLHLAMRHMPSAHAIEELIAFNQRIVQPYAEIMAAARWFHLGSLHVVGLTEYMYADALDVVEAATLEEALANDAQVPMTDHYREIQKGCVEYMDGTRERFAVWMTPLALSAAAGRGVCFFEPSPPDAAER
jgi:hypothetical protein